jgi:N-acetylneuraminic acid mutarotase
LPASSIGATTATLNGNVNANGLPTTAWFEWGADPSFSTYPGYITFFSTPAQSVGSGTTSVPVSAVINTGFMIGTTYYCRIVASNGSGTTRGAILSVHQAPFVTTLAATSVGVTTAELNGIVTPNGLGTTTWFEYGTDSTLASSTSTTSQSVGSGTTSLSVNAVLAGLTNGTTYYYRLAASNSTGTTKGDIASVTTGTAPGPGEWTVTGSMVEPRSSHTATLLQNGEVLIAGGIGAYYLSSAELYVPALGTWSAKGSMAELRYKPTATLLPNGKVLVAGGSNGPSYNLSFLNSAELYDPATSAWSFTGSMTTGRSYHTATILQNGKVLVAGGSNGSVYLVSLSSAELYDPATGTWDNTGSLTVLLGRGPGHTATLLTNGKVLVAGGHNILGALSSAELYDPATGTWTSTGSMAVGRWYHTATTLTNGKVLVAGGIDNTDGITSSAELYDPATGIWENTGSMAVARREPTATLLPNGKVLVAGGWKGGGDSGYLASAELYDPATGAWHNTGMMVAPRSSHTATLLPNGKVLVAGGGYYSGGTGTLPVLAELYNP